MRRPVDLAPGSIFAGRFRVGRLLTARRHTKVHAAEDGATGRPVELEVTTTAVGADFAAHLAARLDRALATPPHPNLLRLVAHGLDPATAAGWAASEPGGPSLVELVARAGPLPQPRALGLTLGLLAGLAARPAAGLGLPGPADVVVTPPPGEAARVRTFDDWASGYPGFTAGPSGDGRLVGCLPPEALEDAASAGPAAAVYLAGACLYLMLTGEPPLRGATTLDTLRQVLGAAPAPLASRAPGVSPALDAAVARALAKAPAQRFPDPGAFAAALSAAAF